MKSGSCGKGEEMSEEIIPQPENDLYSPQSWFDTWIKALTKPSEETFNAIADDPNATLGKGVLWVFVAGMIGFFITSLLGLVISAPSFISDFGYSTPSSFGSILSSLVCGLPIAGIVTVIGLLINAGVVHLSAKAMGGAGTYEKLVYTFASYQAPLALVTSGLALIPYLNCLNLLIFIYIIVLNVISNKAVNKYEWGQAVIAGAVIPLGIVFFFVCCIIGLLTLLGPAIGNVFDEIIRNLETVP
jgi:hypothetical protein